MSNEILTSNQEVPSSFLKNPSAEVIANLKMLGEIFQRIEKETAEIAEMLFEYLIDATDEQIATGTVPPHRNKRIDGYIKILNRLFLFSKTFAKNSGIKIINRKIVKELNKKTFAICMCYDGGISLDILCDVVNEENKVRTPPAILHRLPVNLTVKQVFGKKTYHLTR